ncbi:hypothetical protein KGM_208267 [Danaus plexippus plexippus]|uniref:FLYWCH-type domain-containing protein n=1 Tax=Danaus plexippus plexippus TaxID=278856 RepID=A0A212EXV1_DANPL|nr:hypothetical protein KGM_208267 [Danaus plexippus plexippus]
MLESHLQIRKNMENLPREMRKRIHKKTGETMIYPPTRGTKKLYKRSYEVMSKRGRPLLMYKNYTYAKFPYPLKYGWRWYCSRVKNCKAYLLTTDDNQILAATGFHDHTPTSANAKYPLNMQVRRM